jgi:hypothetical protein
VCVCVCVCLSVFSVLTEGNENYTQNCCISTSKLTIALLGLGNLMVWEKRAIKTHPSRIPFVYFLQSIMSVLLQPVISSLFPFLSYLFPSLLFLKKKKRTKQWQQKPTFFSVCFSHPFQVTSLWFPSHIPTLLQLFLPFS